MNRAQRRAAGQRGPQQPVQVGIEITMDESGSVAMNASPGLTPPLMLWMLRIAEKMLMDQVGETQHGEEGEGPSKIVVPEPQVRGPVRAED